MTTKLVVLALLLVTGCTHGMHRAFQSTMAVVAVGADTCSVLQTRAVLRSPGGAGSETNPLLGTNPGDARLAGAFAFNVGVIAGTTWMPDRGDPVFMDWSKDVLLVTEAALFSFMAYNDNTITGDPHRCGVR